MRRSRLLPIGLFIGLVVWGISIIILNSHPGKVLELKGLDYLFYLRGKILPPEDMVVVAIDGASLKELNLPWPWPRNLHAQLINNLKEAGARIIVYDILFADSVTEEGDNALAQSIKEAGNVVLPSAIDFVEEHGYKQVAEIEPIQIFRDTAGGVGTCTIIYDYDNVIRRGRLKFGRIKSLTYEVLRLNGANFSLLLDKLSESILINYIGPARSIKTVSFYQVLNYKDYLPEDIFRNKIVLVGRSLTASPEPEAKLPDVFLTPRFPNSRTQMAGIEIIANFIDTVLRNRFINELPKPYIYLILLLVLVALAIIEIKVDYVISMFLTILSAIAYEITVYFCFSYNNTLMPVFIPILAVLLIFASSGLTKYFMSEQEKKYIKSAFQKYVPASVVKKILEAPEKLKLGGEEIIGTVLFSDLEKFTSISEKLGPERLVSFINEYLSEMTNVIFRYDGTITRFIGDAILAIWGAPVWHKDHAMRAILSAMEMRDRLKELNIEWKFKDLPELKVRIGLNTGHMVVGNIGSKQHFDYTAMGDSVNLSSRLEEANKFYGTDIIIGNSTYELINNEIECRQLDFVRVKGRKESLEIYEPIATKKRLDKKMGEFLSAYQKGYTSEKNRQWDTAIRYYEEALAVIQDDKPSKIHIERCVKYKENPPPPEWEGVFDSILTP